jgi:CelD/BcsL family acetyltransferase involved in cellulose biosynthesis
MDVLVMRQPAAPEGAPGATELEDVSGVEALEQLRPEWAALCDRCPWTTPFQRPEWLIPWARHFGGGTADAIALRVGGSLAGLLPTLVYRQSSERIVSLLGTGVSDYLDVLLDPTRAAHGAQAMLDRRLKRGDVWNAIIFDSLRSASPLLRVQLPPGWREDVVPQMPSLVLPIAEHAARRTKRLQASLRQAHRRAEREGGIHFEHVSGQAVPEALDALFTLHQKRWAKRGHPGQFGNEAVRAFHRDAAAELSASGRLRLYTLSIGPSLASVYYGFFDGQRAYAYSTGFEPDLARFSPGLLMIEHAIESARQEGAVEFDFLKGQEPHKLLWGASERLLCRRELRPPVF